MSGVESWERRGRSFGSAAETYDRTRPGYPRAALTWALGDAPRTVLDLGAGTGILTRELVARGHETIAVEPDDTMRELCVRTDGATVLAGTAEAIPLPDDSVDAVVVGHAYHWFAPRLANAEIARVLRSGGTLATFWNLRDESVQWSKELSQVLAEEDAGIDASNAGAVMLHGALEALRGNGGLALKGWLKDPSFGDAFTHISREFFPHRVAHTQASLIELVRSRSFYLALPKQQQRALEHELERLLARHFDPGPDQPLELLYVTVAFRARRQPAPVEERPAA
ncbi:MAG TPA: class I SAM-dependent methyltransferase [Conexibacter sp.]|nr:class I SAM-dependent methyltransferase [Conexibacter sp.]